MKRLMKREGQFNFVLEDAPIPSVGPQQVLVRNKITLISRGSESRRSVYQREHCSAQFHGLLRCRCHRSGGP